jgi:F420-non-reducing hydrogenase iron-sulfur subunit
MSFEPKILGFLCNWCSYAGADLAGVSRVQYPPNIRVIRVMCSGRVDPVFVVEALATGLDGVIIMGCHLGDCHYIDGNYEEKMKTNLLSKALGLIGLSERFRLEWVSASEGYRFGQVVTEFTEHIRKLGPSPLKDPKSDIQLRENLEAIKRTLTDNRLRILVGRERTITEFGNVYEEIIDLEEFEKKLEDALNTEFLRNKILMKLEKEPLSVKNLSKLLNTDSSLILEHIVSLKSRNLIDFDRIDGITPYYHTLKEV